MSIYTDFVEDYNNPNITAHDVRRINNLNSKQYTNLRNVAISNGDIPEVRHMNQTTARFYSKRNDGYFDVQKTINGKKLYIGRFPDEDTARQVVRECIKCNWEVNKIRTFIDENKVKPRNYSLINGYYIIQKSINGRNTVFASIPASKVSQSVVEDIVEEFRRVEWNIGYKDEVLNLFNIK